MNKQNSLVDTLFGEVFQTERSALRHCAIEADRLGSTPPAHAMRAVSAHAMQAEEELRKHAERLHHTESKLGTAVGALFSHVRDDLADFTLTSEKSYRGTLLGMRHGCDVVRLFGLAAQREGEHALGQWCERWTAERLPLVEACAAALSWFAENPEKALANAKRVNV